MTLWSRLRRRHESKGFFMDGLEPVLARWKIMEKSACISFFIRKNQNDILKLYDKPCGSRGPFAQEDPA